MFKWKEDSKILYRLFDDDEYIGKLFYTVEGDVVTKVTFVWAQDHSRTDIPLGLVATTGSQKVVVRFVVARMLGKNPTPELLNSLRCRCVIYDFDIGCFGLVMVKLSPAAEWMEKLPEDDVWQWRSL